MILTSKSRKYAGCYYMLRQGTVCHVTVHPERNRGWFTLSSGGIKWKEQSPYVYAKESEAWEALMRQEVYRQRWAGWEAREGKRKIMDAVECHASVDRLYDASCKMWRALQREFGVNK